MVEWRKGVLVRERGFVLAVLTMIAVLSAAILSPAAHAQDKKSTTLMELLFGDRKQPAARKEAPAGKSKPATRKKAPKPKATVRAAPVKRQAAKPASPSSALGASIAGTRSSAPPASPANPSDTVSAPTGPVEKIDAARVILVVGDFVADGLSEGLAEGFEGDSTIRIVSRASGSSGFVRDDFYNWPTEITAILEEEKPGAIVMLVGSNDRQQMRIGGVREAVRSDAWTAEYATRAKAFATEVGKSGIPFLWVGAPPFKFSSMSNDMLALNDIYKASVKEVGGEFIDIWDGFVDAEGNFVTSGSDVSGQTVRLRANDGINFTRSGKRKMAFYAERRLKALLGTSAPRTPDPVLKPENLTTMRLDPIAPGGAVERTNPVAFTDPELDGGSELLGAEDAPSFQLTRSPLQKLVEDGVPPDAQPGRVDDFSWSSEQEKPTTPDITSATR